MNMKIGPLPSVGVSRYDGVQKKASSAGVVRQESDKVDISGASKLFSQALQAAKDMPEVRAEKIEALRQDLQSGNYSVDSRAIAEKMIYSARRV